MKKTLMLLLVAIMLFGISINVNAEDAYYTTANGIELTREEYEFLTTFYWSGYPDVMTRDQYEELVEDDVFSAEIVTESSNGLGSGFIGPVNQPQGNPSTENGRTLQIAKACLPTKCYMSLVATWHLDPSVLGWDVIGAYLYNATLIAHSHTYVSTNAYTYYFDNLKTDENGHGLGNSILLPENGTDYIINMSFTTTKGGTVFGSYQHAMQDTTLANSKLYTFSIGGYGNVFNFYGTAEDIYDQATGVDIDV